MCLIIVGRADVIASRGDWIDAAGEENPDGFGLAIVSELTIAAGWTLSAGDAAYMLRQGGTRTVVAHWRWATTGSVRVENVHPFYVAPHHYAAHNGVLRVPVVGDETDSAAWLRRHVSPHVQRDVRHLNNGRWLRRLESRLGASKVAIARPVARGPVVILNRERGIEDPLTGTWHSSALQGGSWDRVDPWRR